MAHRQVHDDPSSFSLHLQPSSEKQELTQSPPPSDWRRQQISPTSQVTPNKLGFVLVVKLGSLTGHEASQAGSKKEHSSVEKQLQVHDDSSPSSASQKQFSFGKQVSKQSPPPSGWRRQHSSPKSQVAPKKLGFVLMVPKSGISMGHDGAGQFGSFSKQLCNGSTSKHCQVHELPVSSAFSVQTQVLS
jgi:hypothetical protein